MKFPAVLNKSFRQLSPLTNNTIVKTVKEIVENGMTIDMLVGNVTNVLLAQECVQKMNTMNYEFKKALMIRVKIVVDAMKFKFESTTTTMIDEDGNMYIRTVESIVEQEEPTEYKKIWFNDAHKFQDTITLKGSRKVIDNNSTSLLEAKSKITLRVKKIRDIYLDMYAVLMYEDNKLKVNEPDYYARLKEVADETKGFMGYEYTNYRKLDSNSRNYPLNRYGFAYEYGDSFEKFLIEPAQEYLVTEAEIQGAIEYLKNEFGSDNYKRLVANAMRKLAYNESEFAKYEKGRIVNFTITPKELGKLLHIVDIYHNIIDNLGNMSRSCASYDFTNSGGINASNQFGDRKFLKAMNLLGGDEKFDTHQAIADYLVVERDTAKKVMQGPNHGGGFNIKLLQVVNSLGGRQLDSIEELGEMIYSIFGTNYQYIRKIAEYGIKIAKSGITHVILTRPDGIKAVWYPYTIDCDVSMEDGTSVSAVMPFGGNGTNKAVGLAVSILHSADAFTENYITSKLQEEGIHIKTTLDNFYGRPSIKGRVLELTFESLNILTGYAEAQLKEVEKQTGINRGWTLPNRECDLVVSDNIF